MKISITAKYEGAKIPGLDLTAFTDAFDTVGETISESVQEAIDLAKVRGFAGPALEINLKFGE